MINQKYVQRIEGLVTRIYHKGEFKEVQFVFESWLLEHEDFKKAYNDWVTHGFRREEFNEILLMVREYDTERTKVKTKEV